MRISPMTLCGLLLALFVAACAPQQPAPAAVQPAPMAAQPAPMAAQQPAPYAPKETDRGGGGSGY